MTVRIAAKIATICEKIFAKLSLTSDRGMPAKMLQSTREMNASVGVGESSESSRAIESAKRTLDNSPALQCWGHRDKVFMLAWNPTDESVGY